MHEVSGLLIEYQVRDYQVIYPGGHAQRIGIAAPRHVPEGIEEPRPCIRYGVDLIRRHHGRTPVLLHIYHLLVFGSAVRKVRTLGDHTLAVYGVHHRDYLRLEMVEPPQVGLLHGISPFAGNVF